MNLLKITEGIGAVNPRTKALLRQSAGYTTNPDGSRVPAYRPAVDVWAQVQALTFRDIQQVSSLNLQGTRRAIYLQGEWQGLVRGDQQGGDLIVFADGTTWLVAMVLEDWTRIVEDKPNEAQLRRGWVKVAATLQVS